MPCVLTAPNGQYVLPPDTKYYRGKISSQAGTCRTTTQRFLPGFQHSSRLINYLAVAVVRSGRKGLLLPYRYGYPSIFTERLKQAGGRLNNSGPPAASEKPDWLKRGLEFVCETAKEDYEAAVRARAEAEADATYAKKYPLHVAVAANDLPRVKALIESGSHNVNEKDDRGLTPLQVGFDCNKTDSYCWPRIKATTADYLVSKGADVKLDFVPRGQVVPGYTLLHKAAFHGPSSLVKAILKGGADPNAIWYDDIDGKKFPVTPLTRAAYCDFKRSTNDPGTFKALLAAGAKPYLPGTQKPATYAFSVPAEAEKCNAIGACTPAEVDAVMKAFTLGYCPEAWRVVWNAVNKQPQKGPLSDKAGSA